MITDEMRAVIAAYVAEHPNDNPHDMREYLQYEVFWKQELYCTNDEVYNEILAVLPPPVEPDPVEPPQDPEL